MENNVGIYKISCNKSDKVYIGSTNDLADRFGEHLRALRRGLKGVKNGHGNYKLYMAYKKYGEETFSYEILETCGLEALHLREAYWIKFYNSVVEGYNIAIDTEYPFRGIPKPKSWHDKMDKAYHLIDPDGNEVKGKGLMEFCRKNDLTQQAMGRVLKGGIQQNKGWRKYSPELVGIPFDKAATFSQYRRNSASTRKNKPFPLSEETLRIHLNNELSYNDIGRLCGKVPSCVYKECKRLGLKSKNQPGFGWMKNKSK